MKQNHGDLNLPLGTIIALLAAIVIFIAMIFMFRQVFGRSALGG